MKKSFLIALFFAFSATITFSQTPTTIPGKIAYQGKLLENGLPVTGTRTIEFSIPGTGWTETHNNVAIVTGLYSVQLGSITPIPVTVFNSPTVSLEIIVEGTTLSPQVELLSVPYAYNSENAANIAGNRVSTTTPAIGQTLQWDGTAWVPDSVAVFLQAKMDSISSSPIYTIGLNPDLGGYVFYVTPNGKHGLVAALQDQSSGVTWYEANDVCNDPSLHDAIGKEFTDWRLPTKRELNLMYSQRAAIGITQNAYWSSVERYSTSAWYWNFNTGYQSNHDKNSGFCVRSVRAF